MAVDILDILGAWASYLTGHEIDLERDDSYSLYVYVDGDLADIWPDFADLEEAFNELVSEWQNA